MLNEDEWKALHQPMPAVCPGADMFALVADLRNLPTNPITVRPAYIGNQIVGFSVVAPRRVAEAVAQTYGLEAPKVHDFAALAALMEIGDGFEQLMAAAVEFAPFIPGLTVRELGLELLEGSSVEERRQLLGLPSVRAAVEYWKQDTGHRTRIRKVLASVADAARGRKRLPPKERKDLEVHRLRYAAYLRMRGVVEHCAARMDEGADDQTLQTELQTPQFALDQTDAKYAVWGCRHHPDNPAMHAATMVVAKTTNRTFEGVIEQARRGAKLAAMIDETSTPTE